MRTKNVIIWAGISGVVLAQRLSERWEDVLIIEKRNHIWWNCYDYFDENGILIHKYWPHIFHTDIDDVWLYLNRFTEFNNFQHKVLAWVEGNLIPVPFNFNSIEQSFPRNFASKLEETLLQYFPYGSKVSITDLRQRAVIEENEDLNFIAEYIFEKVFKNYTIKQWGITADEIDQNVLKRVPISMSRDDRYFPHNKYQWMPKNGYTKMFENMLDSTNIKILLNTDYKEIIWDIDFNRLYYTGPIDEYFNCKYWKLDYRKTLYYMETHDMAHFQSSVVINYPNDYAYTRITEFKKFYPLSPTYGIDKTVTCKEIPWVWDIEAYPIETSENLRILEKYKEEAESLENIYFLWRLANYKYLDMDKTVKNALDINI